MMIFGGRRHVIYGKESRDDGHVIMVRWDGWRRPLVDLWDVFLLCGEGKSYGYGDSFVL